MSKSLVKKALELCEDSNGISKNKNDLKRIKNKNEAYRTRGKVSKSLVEKCNEQKNKKKALLTNNLSYLNKISKPVVKYDLIESVLNKKSKPKEHTKKVEESVFTEEDFKNFEKSYF
ncbi:active regulator of SIRT1 [Brachionus plicatilis]|uniref:Active regulator of SIRT1 n=1 Tax=Brachionus plicatilis TaxID=10195 RepID=A0A3M7PUK0_BRAPC|nr:active regulator of SIRT1 [Brachionus plicatilis]